MEETDSGDASERYEFDAPSHVVDLQELESAQNDDKWFGTFPRSILELLIRFVKTKSTVACSLFRPLLPMFCGVNNSDV